MLKDTQLKISCLLIGEDYCQVKNYQYSSKRKISLMGSSLLIPVLTWMVFTTAISVNIYKEPLLFSICIGCFASFVVFLIERSIVLAKPKEKSITWVASFRIVIGVTIALLSASFIDQIFFQKDIDMEVVALRTQNLDEIDSKVKNKYSEQVAALEFAEKQSLYDWQLALNSVATEADGTGGGKFRGVGKVTQLKQAIANEKEHLYKNAESQLEKIIHKRDTEIQNKKSNTGFSEDGFLTRISALFSLIFKSWHMGFYYFLVNIFFISIELLVVILKFSSKQSIDEFLEEKRELLERERINKLTTNNLNLITSSYQNTHIENSKKKMSLLQILN